MLRIRILIADDHALVRSGFRAMLAGQVDLEVVGEAADGVVVVGECQRLTPDVVLLDLTMPGRSGIDAIQDLRQSCPQLKVLVVTMHEDEAYARQAIAAGAAGYVLKKSLARELLAAIRAVHRGQTYMAPSLASVLTEPCRSLPHSRPGDNAEELLTPRESEVVNLAALGYTNAEIASRLHISDRTVETHRLHIMTKLGLRNRADLVRFALEHKLVGK
jgi:two-component system, NarL family, response regulator NreC